MDITHRLAGLLQRFHDLAFSGENETTSTLNLMEWLLKHAQRHAAKRSLSRSTTHSDLFHERPRGMRISANVYQPFKQHDTRCAPQVLPRVSARPLPVQGSSGFEFGLFGSGFVRSGLRLQKYAEISRGRLLVLEKPSSQIVTRDRAAVHISPSHSRSPSSLKGHAKPKLTK